MGQPNGCALPERVARLEVERVVSLCLETADFKSVLDVGVGSGLFSEAFSKQGWKYLAWMSIQR